MLTPFKICKLSYISMTDIVVCGGVTLQYWDHTEMWFECLALPIHMHTTRYNNITNYDPNVCSWIHISTESTIIKRYRNSKSRVKGRTVVLDWIRLSTCTCNQGWNWCGTTRRIFQHVSWFQYGAVVLLCNLYSSICFFLYQHKIVHVCATSHINHTVTWECYCEGKIIIGWFFSAHSQQCLWT